MRAKKKTKLIPMITAALLMGMMLLTFPLTASASEPPEDNEGEYQEYSDEYRETMFDEYGIGLPDEYYYPSMQPAFEEGPDPLTPDGTGTVIDNATDEDGKEFYTIETPDGNVFYLIIDRQRNTDNVYFLGAVTEEDLLSLAQPGNGKPAGMAETPPITEDTEPETEKAEPEPVPEPAKGSDNTMFIAVAVVAVIGIGGAAYYFKIQRPKQEGTYSDDDYEEYNEQDEPENRDGYDRRNDEEEAYDEDGYEEDAGNYSNEHYDSPYSPDDSGYSSGGDWTENLHEGSSPQYQGNRNQRRHKKKRKNHNYSG